MHLCPMQSQRAQRQSEHVTVNNKSYLAGQGVHDVNARANTLGQHQPGNITQVARQLLGQDQHVVLFRIFRCEKRKSKNGSWREYGFFYENLDK